MFFFPPPEAAHKKLLFLLLAPFPAKGDLVTVVFSAAAARGETIFGIPVVVGDIMVGSFVYDTNTADDSPGELVGTYSQPGFEFRINGRTFAANDRLDITDDLPRTVGSIVRTG